MKYDIITYGCQMNKSDSERIATMLEKAGHKKAASEKTADLVVLNACSVRQSAVDRLYGKIKQLQIANRESRIILTGCLLEEDKKKLRPKVDLIFGINDLPKLPTILKNFRNSKFEIKNWRTHKPEENIQSCDYFKIQPRRNNNKSAYVPIMTGCDNFCSYCVVPYTRGREKSRPTKDIITEIKTLVKKGYKEIILLGQNVNSYKFKIQKSKIKITNQNLKLLKGDKTITFPLLLKIINELPGNFKIQFITAHPKDMNDATIEALKLPKISNYLHLPVQSGSNRILKLMNRHYTAGHYLKLLQKIRQARPDIKISTDIIVGFPGENKKDFLKTVQLCKMAGFTNAYIARYSPRAGTLSARIYRDDVPPEEKKRRWLTLDNLINKKSAF